MSVVPVDQVLASDGGDRLVLGDSRVWALGAVGQLGGFAAYDFIDVVVAARDGVEILSLDQFKLVVAKFRALATGRRTL